MNSLRQPPRGDGSGEGIFGVFIIDRPSRGLIRLPLPKLGAKRRGRNDLWSG